MTGFQTSGCIGIMAVPAELQCSPHSLQFSAHVGQDAPLRFTLFNPHPAQRIAFKVRPARRA